MPAFYGPTVEFHGREIGARALMEKKRREALGAMAAARGWSWVERDDRWADAFDGQPFGSGHNRQARNILQGQHDGRPFVGFDYVYYTTETSTDSASRYATNGVASAWMAADRSSLSLSSSMPSASDAR